jgi:hypothetical protein
VVLTDDLLVAIGPGGIEAFDARNGRRRWRHASIGTGAVTLLKERVMAVTSYWHLVVFSSQGTVVWRVPYGSGVNVYGNRVGPRRPFALGDHLGVLWANRLEWRDRSTQEWFGRLLATSRGLLSSNSNYRLELRAADSGEVLEIWPDKAQGIAVSPSGNAAAFTTADGSLWLLPARPAR